MPVLTLERPLRQALGEEACDSLVRLLNQAQENQKNDILEFVEEKFERRLSEELNGLELRLSDRISTEVGALNEKIASVESRLSEKIASVESRLSEKISNSDNKTSAIEKSLSDKIASVEKKTIEMKAELIKWMFIFWLGQVGAILGILFAFFKQ